MRRSIRRATGKTRHDKTIIGRPTTNSYYEIFRNSIILVWSVCLCGVKCESLIVAVFVMCVSGLVMTTDI